MTLPSPPKVSVLIASHNRRDLLRRCLDSLGRQTQDPGTFEVIVADDGSSDGTAEMLAAMETEFRLRVLRLAKGGQQAAQTAALQVAQAPVCLLLDDDVIPSPELIAEHLAAHLDNPMAIGVGALTQQPVAARDWYAHAFAKGLSEHYEELAKRPANWTDCYGGNLSCPRETLLQIGGFAVNLARANDFDLAFRLCRAGCVPRYLPRARGIHDDQKRAASMLGDARRQGQMHVELSNRYPEAEPDLLDWAAGAGPRELALRRISLALRVPPSPLVWLGRFVPGEGRKMIWLHFVRKLAFWSGVRQSVSRSRWKLITTGQADASAQGTM
jgi:glycosyltransferase involved in cell wall biosynthesis